MHFDAQPLWLPQGKIVPDGSPKIKSLAARLRILPLQPSPSQTKHFSDFEWLGMIADEALAIGTIRARTIPRAATLRISGPVHPALATLWRTTRSSTASQGSSSCLSCDNSNFRRA